MKINIIAVGKLQKDFIALFNSYQKKISFYATLNVFEVREFNHDNKEVQIEKETAAILKLIPKDYKVLLCSLQGKQYNSNEFSNLINEDNMTFVIGGSHGVDESKFQEKINFSKMTFPHQLFRIFLVEQIFRSFSIKNNTKYHK